MKSLDTSRYKSLLYKKNTSSDVLTYKGYKLGKDSAGNDIPVNAGDDKYLVVCIDIPDGTEDFFIALPDNLNVEKATLITQRVTYNAEGIATSVKTYSSTSLLPSAYRPFIGPRKIYTENVNRYCIEFYGINNELSTNVSNKETLFYEGRLANPIYKKLSKKYVHEENQYFFRESLDSKLSFHGKDFDFIKSAALNTDFAFCIYAYKGGPGEYDNNYQWAGLTISCSFSKVDCKFDNLKKKIEPKFQYEDRYSNILKNYESTYDLIRLAPAISRPTYTIRPALQFYVAGANSSTLYFNGLYDEADVVEAVTDESILKKCAFEKQATFQEIDLSGLVNALQPAIFIFDENSKTWKSQGNARIEMQLLYPANAYLGENNIPSFYNLNENTVDGAAVRYETWPDYAGAVYYTAKDIYKVVVIGEDGEVEATSAQGYTLPASGPYTLVSGETGYTMNQYGGSTFELASCISTSSVWARLLSASDNAPHVIASDDFAPVGAAYKRAGAVNFSLKSFLHCSAVTTEQPTKFGIAQIINQVPRYFTNNFYSFPATTLRTLLPLGRNSWVNTSFWIESLSLSDFTVPGTSWNAEDYYLKRITLQDSYHLPNVIHALLQAIDPSIKHAYSEEYSLFLYAETNPLTNESNYIINRRLFITQITNILKGQYDQAAQKAELSLKSLMDMLRDCYRCYWFIDNENRFRIEHISYFLNGGNYDFTGSNAIDLTTLNDGMLKKPILLGQELFEFDKSELVPRYEFAWPNESSEALGGNLAIDFTDKYIPEDAQIKEITISNFSVDFDLMLLFPERFNNDGFAMMAADTNGVVPIAKTILIDSTTSKPYKVSAQNVYLSWQNLINHNYLYDMPGKDMAFSTIPSENAYLAGEQAPIGKVKKLKKCLIQEIQIPNKAELTINSAIKTNLGIGFISEMSIDLISDIVTATLNYYPDE